MQPSTRGALSQHRKFFRYQPGLFLGRKRVHKHCDQISSQPLCPSTGSLSCSGDLSVLDTLQLSSLWKLSRISWKLSSSSHASSLLFTVKFSTWPLFALLPTKSFVSISSSLSYTEMLEYISALKYVPPSSFSRSADLMGESKSSSLSLVSRAGWDLGETSLPLSNWKIKILHEIPGFNTVEKVAFPPLEFHLLSPRVAARRGFKLNRSVT